MNTDPSLELSDSVVEELPPPERKVPWLRISQSVVINLFLPFLNGIMLGIGEIMAHELGVLYGWREARVYDPATPVIARRRKWLWRF